MADKHLFTLHHRGCDMCVCGLLSTHTFFKPLLTAATHPLIRNIPLLGRDGQCSRLNRVGLASAVDLGGKKKKTLVCLGSRLRTVSLLPPCVIARAYRELEFCPLLLVKPPLVKALKHGPSSLQLNIARQWYRFPLQKDNWKGCHKFVHCHWVAITFLLIAIIVMEY